MQKKMNEYYKSFEHWRWNNFDGTAIVNIDEFISNHMENYFFIGTDSQNYKKNNQCVFTTVLIGYKMGKGGQIISHTNRTMFIDALRQRLMLEAMMSLELGWYLSSKVSKDKLITIHLDVNQSTKFASGKYKQELVSLVASQGFKVIVKPDAWAASTAADLKT